MSRPPSRRGGPHPAGARPVHAATLATLAAVAVLCAAALPVHAGVLDVAQVIDAITAAGEIAPTVEGRIVRLD